jgi:hypothetical protein
LTRFPGRHRPAWARRLARGARRILIWSAALAAILAVGAAHGRDRDEIPPATAKRLSEIVRSVEAQGHTVITDIDFDDWVWIIRVYKGGFEFVLRVDPVTGEIESIRPVPGP